MGTNTTRIAEAVAMVGVRRMASTFVLSAAGLATLQGHEAVVLKVYKDTTGTPTACMGHTGSDLPAVGTPLTRAICERLTRQDVSRFEKDVASKVKIAITQEQFDALVDFDLNVGERAFGSSTLLKKINLGQCIPAAAEFAKWQSSKGVVLRGLVVRRHDEATAWLSGC
jgi:lysozyme